MLFIKSLNGSNNPINIYNVESVYAVDKLDNHGNKIYNIRFEMASGGVYNWTYSNEFERNQDLEHILEKQIKPNVLNEG